MKKITVLCDTCTDLERGRGIFAHHKDIPVQVIFESNQEDGKKSEPYLDMVKLDLCDDCKKRMLAGERIFASGAMGNNIFYFKD